MQLFTSQDIKYKHRFSLHKILNWWTGVMWTIVMFLSAVWTLILTAPIHCTGSTGEQESNTTFLQIWDGLRWGYDPWTSKGYNPTFLQTSSDVETNSSTSWMAWEFMFSTFSSIPLKTNTKEESHCQTQTAIRCRIDYMHFLKYKTVVKAFHAHIVLIWPTMDKLAELMDVVTSEMIVYITTSYHIPLCNVWVPSDPSLCRNQSQQIAVIWVTTNVTSVIWLELFPCYI